MDPKVKKSRLSTTGGEESDAATSAASLVKEEKVPRSSSSASPSNRSISPQEEPTVSGRDRSSHPEKPDKQIRTKYPQGKKKVKVDWTPELHKKFVQAVEKLGIDKAVPSRILELMGIDCLTRHNVASHLQKYRSHRKHMLAREAEALSWTRRRQIRGSASNPRTGKRDTNAYGSTTTTTGFPHHHNNSRPLHVWGHPPHPYADQSLMYTWAANQPRDPTLWYWHQNVPAQGLPCYSPYMPPARPATPVVPGIIANPSVYRVGVPFLPNGQTLSRQPYDELQSKERIDAVIGDVLSKPWLPLPLGLRAPSFDTVMVELQRQGISKVPPPSFA